MDKKDLKPFKATITFNKAFADYYDEAIEQLRGEGFLDARNPHKASALPLWEDWDLTQEDDGTWVFTATVYGISEDDAKIATNVAYTDVDCAALRHLVRTEVEAMELVSPALPKGFGLDAEPENVNDLEFVRIVLDGEPATYSYRFEVEQRFVLDHEDELKLSKVEARWWHNHGTNDATISDWQMWEAELIYTVRESKNFADLIK